MTPPSDKPDEQLDRLAASIALIAFDSELTSAEPTTAVERTLADVFRVLRASGTTVDLDDVERRVHAVVTRERRARAQ